MSSSTYNICREIGTGTLEICTSMLLYWHLLRQTSMYKYSEAEQWS